MRVDPRTNQKTKIWLLGAVCLFSIVAVLTPQLRRYGAIPGAEDTPGPHNSQIQRDVRYNEASDLNMMDLYIPKGEGDHPILIFVHGGGWTTGDKSKATHAYSLADRGILVAAMNYRLAPQFVHPTQTQDVARAIVWLQAHARRYGANPKEIFLVAHSTGAHPVALVATDPQYLKAEGATPNDISGVILLDGRAYDIQRDMAIANPHDRQMYLSVFGSNSKQWIQASPVYNIKRHAGVPPFLIFYGIGRYPGQEDRKRSDSEELFHRLRNVGVEAQIIHTTQAHSALESLFGAPHNDVTDQILAFIGRYRSVEARGTTSPAIDKK